MEYKISIHPPSFNNCVQAMSLYGRGRVEVGCWLQYECTITGITQEEYDFALEFFPEIGASVKNLNKKGVEIK